MSKSLRRLRLVVFGAVGMRMRRLRVGRLAILQGICVSACDQRVRAGWQYTSCSKCRCNAVKSCKGRLPTLSPREVMVSVLSHLAEFGVGGVLDGPCLPRSSASTKRDHASKRDDFAKVVDRAQVLHRVRVGVDLDHDIELKRSVYPV
jgi:hypothetical protein